MATEIAESNRPRFLCVSNALWTVLSLIICQSSGSSLSLSKREIDFSMHPRMWHKVSLDLTSNRRKIIMPPRHFLILRTPRAPGNIRNSFSSESYCLGDAHRGLSEYYWQRSESPCRSAYDTRIATAAPPLLLRHLYSLCLSYIN